ncbi:MAG TPA: metallophosphoesterase family protein [Gemmatimonadales bacterium]|nr:metallophosphoesterase family protein [Gemmatimonadales bacterium]
MRLGIISDTHGLLRPQVHELFSGVDLILHAGDIGAPELLAELETIAPVRAVWGNTDDFDIRRMVPEVVEARIEGFDFLIVHGHQLGAPTPDALHARWPDAEIIIFGHTHRPLLVTVDQVVTVMNPGGAGSRRFDLPASVGIMELEPGIPPRARLVPLTGAGEV